MGNSCYGKKRIIDRAGKLEWQKAQKRLKTGAFIAELGQRDFIPYHPQLSHRIRGLYIANIFGPASQRRHFQDKTLSSRWQIDRQTRENPCLAVDSTFLFQKRRIE